MLTFSYTIATGAGQATSADYTPALTGAASILSGQSFVDLTITPVNDILVEGNETVTLTLGDSGSYDVGAAATATATIADNQIPIFTSGPSFTVKEANTLGVTGPQSSASPYLTSRDSGVQFTSILTVGDTVSGYRMVGIPDGMGAYDNNDGTFTLLMNHEIIHTLGVARAHGQKGSFVSSWVVNKYTLQVVSIQDFLQNNTSVYLSDYNQTTGTVHSGYLAAATTIISRLCPADLAAPTAYQWTDSGTGTVYGTAARIFQSGEESGGLVTGVGPEVETLFGRQFAFVATDDQNTALNEAGTAWELPHGGLFAWENNLANPLAQRKTIVTGMDDGSPIGQVYMWVGDKQTAGNVVERAGLTRQGANDNMYVLRVPGLSTVDGSGVPIETVGTPVSGAFTMVNEGDVSGLTFAGLEALSDSSGAAQFLRPEDGTWDPNNPSDFYFVTTSQYDQTKDGVGSQVGRSRLYKLHFTDIANPEVGGTITSLLDGTEAGNMFDNMTISGGKIIIQEDPGNQEHLAKVWSYDIATDALTEIAQHDRARFGDVGVPATSPFNRDEESSGVIDMSEILGPDTFLLNVQAHYAIGGELVEGGQLLMMRTNVTSGQQLVTTVTASDVDSSPLTFAIAGGDDGAKFDIDPATGALSFKIAPNFESPTDVGGNNVYDVTVSVTDGVNPAVTQAVQVTVTAVNETPVNTTTTAVSVAENSTAVTTLTGTDPEGVALAYAISGGADAVKFNISGSGVLTFLAAPNFEAPTDNGANNSYFVTVTVSDGVNAPVNKTVVVTVTNVTELGGIDVQNGQTQRSYIRYLDVLFDQPNDLMNLISNGRFQVTKSDLNGNSPSIVPLPLSSLSVSGNKVVLDFGIQGLGGNRNSAIGDGFYELGVDLDGNGSFESKRYFYRLLGDVNGDRIVNSLDSSLVTSAFGSSNPERDVNGDGIVNANDRTFLLRNFGRKLNEMLWGLLND